MPTRRRRRARRATTPFAPEGQRPRVEPGCLHRRERARLARRPPAARTPGSARRLGEERRPRRAVPAASHRRHDSDSKHPPVSPPARRHADAIEIDEAERERELAELLHERGVLRDRLVGGGGEEVAAVRVLRKAVGLARHQLAQLGEVGLALAREAPAHAVRLQPRELAAGKRSGEQRIAVESLAADVRELAPYRRRHITRHLLDVAARVQPHRVPWSDSRLARNDAKSRAMTTSVSKLSTST